MFASIIVFDCYDVIKIIYYYDCYVYNSYNVTRNNSNVIVKSAFLKYSQIIKKSYWKKAVPSLHAEWSTK